MKEHKTHIPPHPAPLPPGERALVEVLHINIPSPLTGEGQGGGDKRRGDLWGYPLFNSRGISVLFLVIAMMLMVAIGYVFSYLIPTKQKSVALTISSTQAFFIAQSGVEFAIRYAQVNGVGDLNGMTRSFGTPPIGRFSLIYNSAGTGTLTSVGEVPIGTERRRVTVSNFTSFLAPITINYHGSASTPYDNGPNTSDPTVVTPPAGMQRGDLVLMMAASRDSSATISISSTGGQIWTPENQVNQINCRIRLFWCRFNGTWSANPSVSFGNNNPHIVVMHVFRPSRTNIDWQVDVPQVSGTYAAPASPYTVTIPGITTITNGALVFAGWASTDNNTWGSLTAGWFTPGLAQYRTISGADLSQTHAYRVMATAGATGNVSKNQLTLGGDPGARLIIAFKAILTCS